MQHIIRAITSTLIVLVLSIGGVSLTFAQDIPENTKSLSFGNVLAWKHIHSDNVEGLNRIVQLYMMPWNSSHKAYVVRDQMGSLLYIKVKLEDKKTCLDGALMPVRGVPQIGYVITSCDQFDKIHNLIMDLHINAGAKANHSVPLEKLNR